MTVQKRTELKISLSRNKVYPLALKGFLGGSDGKKKKKKTSACNARDPGLILGLRRSPGEVNGYALQYSCPENSMKRRAVHRLAKS